MPGDTKYETVGPDRAPWNQSKRIGQKPPLTRKAIGTIRIRLPWAQPARERALFHLAIDRQWRVRDAAQGGSGSSNSVR